MLEEVKFNFTGKNFVVVGASSGLGRQIALELAEAGARVLALGRNRERLEALQQTYPEQIAIDRIDVTLADSAEWKQVLGRFTEVYDKVDGGIYTAGITGFDSLKYLDKNLGMEIMNTSFWGALEFFSAITKRKVSKDNASFVAFSSIAAYESPKGLAVYSGAKAALQATMRSILKEVAGRGQRINTISPGLVDTEMTRSHYPKDYQLGYLGLGKAQDISGMVLFLLSNRAAWITGQDFLIDGGSLYCKK